MDRKTKEGGDMPSTHWTGIHQMSWKLLRMTAMIVDSNRREREIRIFMVNCVEVGASGGEALDMPFSTSSIICTQLCLLKLTIGELPQHV